MEAAEYLNQLLSLGDMQNGNFSSEDIAAQKQLIDSLAASIAASDPKPKEVSLDEEEGPVPDRVHYEEDSAPTPQEATDQKVQDLMSVAQEYYEPENAPVPRKESYEPGATDVARTATEGLDSEETETQKLDELVHQSVVDYAKQQGVDYNDLFAHKGASEVAREAIPEVRYKQETRVPSGSMGNQAAELSRQVEQARGLTDYPDYPRKDNVKDHPYVAAPAPRDTYKDWQKRKAELEAEKPKMSVGFRLVEDDKPFVNQGPPVPAKPIGYKVGPEDIAEGRKQQAENKAYAERVASDPALAEEEKIKGEFAARRAAELAAARAEEQQTAQQAAANFRNNRPGSTPSPSVDYNNNTIKDPISGEQHLMGQMGADERLKIAKNKAARARRKAQGGGGGASGGAGSSGGSGSSGKKKVKK